jgi:two-component system, chemotaxis family, protein-glutamate methylesterase/glutaminase
VKPPVKRTRVLVVDDSRTSRLLMVEILRADAEVEVVGQAADGIEAVEMAKVLRPDIITMDVQMPRLDGFGATKRIMVENPTPILITTSVDPRSLAVSLEAVRMGALAVQAKPRDPLSPTFDDEASEFVRQVKAMSRVKVVRHYSTPAPAPRALAAHAVTRLAPLLPAPPVHDVPAEIVAIAASTGGPAALHYILTTLPADFPVPILVVQHISRGFTPGFAGWLDKASPLHVKLAEEGELLVPGTVYIAVDDHHLCLTPSRRIQLSKAPAVGGFRPSGTVLFQSVANTFGSTAVAVILTGMGRDGVDGLRAIRNAGGRTVAESEDTAVIYGMPAAAVHAGLADYILPLDQVCAAVTGLLVATGARKL